MIGFAQSGYIQLTVQSDQAINTILQAMRPHDLMFARTHSIGPKISNASAIRQLK